jgi:hypothetical protein
MVLFSAGLLLGNHSSPPLVLLFKKLLDYPVVVKGVRKLNESIDSICSRNNMAILALMFVAEEIYKPHDLSDHLEISLLKNSASLSTFHDEFSDYAALFRLHLKKIDAIRKLVRRYSDGLMACCRFSMNRISDIVTKYIGY